jgi:hypothetical protein
MGEEEYRRLAKTAWSCDRSSKRCSDETFGKGPKGEGGLLKRSQEVTGNIVNIWTDMDGKLAKPTETNIV